MGVNCLIFTGDNKWVSKYAGAYRIATELRKNGYTVQVVDLLDNKNYDLTLKLIIKKFVDHSTLWIGFSTNFLDEVLGYKFTGSDLIRESYHKKNPDCDSEIKKLISHAKSINPSIKFVVGGVKTFNFDHLGFYRFKGYTDSEIVDFTDRCAAGETIADTLIENTEFKDFVKSQIDFTHRDVFNGEKSLPIEIGRGCIFRCKFCNYPLTGKTKNDHIRDYGLIREEMFRNYERFGITHYNFAEDTYNDNIVKLQGLYDNVFSKLPFKITFSAYLRLDLLMRHPESKDLLVASGLKSALFGIETLNLNNAKIIGKGVDPNLQIETIARLKQDEFKDINCASGFILGLPHDTTTEIDGFANWIFNNNNPLDDWYINALYISPVEYQSEFPYKSEFDLSYKKYGYEFSYNYENKLMWHNKRSNLNQQDMINVATDLMNESIRSNKRKYGGFMYSYALDLGYDADLLLTKSRIELDQKYDKDHILQQKKINYYKKLLSLPTTQGRNQ